ncbi:hypothetical protein JCM16303_003959 [Sporobolomyces ruberrimus]
MAEANPPTGYYNHTPFMSLEEQGRRILAGVDSMGSNPASSAYDFNWQQFAPLPTYPTQQFVPHRESQVHQEQAWCGAPSARQGSGLEPQAQPDLSDLNPYTAPFAPPTPFHSYHPR